MPPTDDDSKKSDPWARDAKSGRFLKGGPGKLAGTRYRATRIIEKVLQSDLKEVCNAVVTAAKTGNMTAALAIISRLAPPARFVSRPIALAAIGGTAEEARSEIIRLTTMAAAGEISLDDLDSLSNALKQAADTRLIELEKLVHDLAAERGMQRG
jgi:hypothetical protein